MMPPMSQNYYLVFPESNEMPAGVAGYHVRLSSCGASKIERLTGKASGLLPLSGFVDRYWYISAPGRAFLK